MKLLRTALALSLTACIIMRHAPARAQGLIEPLVYPAGRVCAGSTVLIWQDIHHERDTDAGARYRLTLRGTGAADAAPSVTVIEPRVYFGAFYAYSLPAPLAAGGYEFTIERMIGGDAVSTRYYHYLRYPVKREFTVDPALPGRLCALPPDYLIRCLQLDRANTLANGYNALFFAGSGVLSFGMGMLFYSVIHFGIISTVIYVVSFISAAAGLSASGYYGRHYFSNRAKLEKLADIGGAVSLNGAVLDGRMLAAVEARY